jgi:RNA polymerase sigma factor (sigma-70 family)
LSEKKYILPHITEEELIDGCKLGNTHYQQKLYNYFANKMFAVCLRYAHNYHDAEDLLQEGFIKIFKNIDKFRNEGSFEGWIRRIFVNTAIEFYRKSNTLYTLVEVNVNMKLDTVDENAISKINTTELMGFIQKLSPGYRTIFCLYAIEGYTHREIGELLSINEGTSKSQLARARMLLQKMLLDAQQYINTSYVIVTQ